MDFSTPTKTSQCARVVTDAMKITACASRRPTSRKVQPFRGLKLAAGPCRGGTPSYMRLTVAISRVFDRWGSGSGCLRGPTDPPQKEGYEDHGKGHWDRPRHDEFVRRRDGWQIRQSDRERRGHADDPVD